MLKIRQIDPKTSKKCITTHFHLTLKVMMEYPAHIQSGDGDILLHGIMHFLQVESAKLHMLKVACVASCTCFKLNVFSSCMYCKLHMLQAARVARSKDQKGKKVNRSRSKSKSRSKCQNIKMSKYPKVKTLKGQKVERLNNL